MLVKIKRLDEKAVIPKYAKPGDAGLDIVATYRSHNPMGNYYEYSTGLEFEIPNGYVGLLFPRSSISKKDLILCNSVGVLDSGYRGEVTFRFKSTSEYPRLYEPGERIGQIVIVPYPQITFHEVESLTESARGKGGYGSTGE